MTNLIRDVLLVRMGSRWPIQVKRTLLNIMTSFTVCMQLTVPGFACIVKGIRLHHTQ